MYNKWNEKKVNLQQKYRNKINEKFVTKRLDCFDYIWHISCNALTLFRPKLVSGSSNCSRGRLADIRRWVIDCSRCRCSCPCSCSLMTREENFKNYRKSFSSFSLESRTYCTRNRYRQNPMSHLRAAYYWTMSRHVRRRTSSLESSSLYVHVPRSRYAYLRRSWEVRKTFSLLSEKLRESPTVKLALTWS